MEKIILEASKREVTGKQVKALRREGKLPAILYGHNVDAQPILLDYRAAASVLGRVTASTPITLVVDGQTHQALVKTRQKDPVKGHLLHIDFQVISATERIRALVQLEFTGVSPAVRDLGGTLMPELSQLEVESLLADLPEKIEIDLSAFTEIGQSITVRDLGIPEGVRVLTSPDEMVAVVAGATVEEEEAPAVTEEEVAEPERVTRRKETEEEEEE
jgi:large subunit ribosomal protein L25